jgi:hypothetical protein
MLKNAQFFVFGGLQAVGNELETGAAKALVS